MFRFSTRENPDVPPAEAMRAIFGQMDVDTLDGHPLAFSVRGLSLPSVRISAQESGPFRYMGHAYRADEGELRLSLSERGGGNFNAMAGEVCMAEGDALIHPVGGSTGEIFRPASWRSVSVSRAALAPLIKPDAMWKLRRVPSAHPGVALLRHYIDGLLAADGSGVAIAGLEAVVATHIRDLAALVVGANRDGAEQARSGGVMAARFQAARRFVAENLLNPHLTEETVAKALGISPRYVKKLFASQAGFHNHLNGQRLDLAYSLLTNPLHLRTKVIDIAFHCGFSSLPTFNRRFKDRHGLSPSEARHAVADQNR